MPNSSPRKAVLFDFDGVLVPTSNEAYFPVYHAAFEKVGFQLSGSDERQLVLQYWSWPSSHFFRHLFAAEPERARTAIRTYREALFSDLFLDAIDVDPRLGPMLERLGASGWSLGIVSGANGELLQRVLARYGLTAHFGCVLSGYDFAREHQKPSPHMLFEACRRLECEPRTSLYVGDSDTDVEAAHRAGMRFCAVLTGNLTHEQAQELGAQWIVRTAADLEVAVCQAADGGR